MTRYERGFLSKCAEYGVDGRRLLKMAFGMDPTANWETYTPAPSSPATLRTPSMSHPIDPAKHREAAEKSSPNMFYGLAAGPAATATAAAAPALTAAGLVGVPALRALNNQVREYFGGWGEIPKAVLDSYSRAVHEPRAKKAR